MTPEETVLTTEGTVLASVDRSLSQRLGGRWLVSLPGYFTSVVLTFGVLLAHLTVRPANGSGGPTDSAASDADVPLMFGYWVVSVVFAAVVAVTAHFTAYRRRALQPVPLWMAVAYWVATLVPSAIIYELGRDAAGLVTERSLLWRVVEVALLGMLSSAAMVLALDYATEFRRLRNDFIEKRIQTVLLEQSRQGFYEEVERQLHGEIGESIRAVDPTLLAEFETSPSADLLPSTSRIIATLRRVSSEVVQPVSRTLWRMSAETYPPLRAGEFVRTLLVRQPFATKSLVVLTVLANYASIIDEAGVARGVLYLVAGACVITAICSAANHLMRRAPRYHVVIVAAAFGLLQLATHGVNELRPTLGLAARPDGLLLLQVAWSAVFVVATMSFGVLRRLRKEHLAKFAAEVDEERVVAIAKSRKVADFARETSRVLHGAVQTRLTVCSLMIERARESNDEAALGLALMEAVAILQTPVEPVAGQETVGGEVARKVALWDGFCAISVAVDPQLIDSPNAAARDVGRVVEEAISNAVRHGGASHISVKVSLGAGGAVSVTVEDDGIGNDDGNGNGNGNDVSKAEHATDIAHRGGVGSAMFDQITGGDWTLTRRNNRTLFHATLPAPLRQ